MSGNEVESAKDFGGGLLSLDAEGVAGPAAVLLGACGAGIAEASRPSWAATKREEYNMIKDSLIGDS